MQATNQQEAPAVELGAQTYRIVEVSAGNKFVLVYLCLHHRYL